MRAGAYTDTHPMSTPDSNGEPKRLTTANWMEPDPASLVSGLIALPGLGGLPGLAVLTPPWPERLKLLLEPRVSAVVPRDVAELVATAQGAMAYGYFYYPLYTLGVDHLYRALEAAVVHRARAEGFTGKRLMLKDALDWLASKGIIDPSRRRALEPFRTLRNEASHPKFQSLFTPGMALTLLDDISREINSLSEPRAP